MSIALTNPLQSLGTGDVNALALKQFSGKVIAHFEQISKFWPMIAKRPLESGSSVQFPAMGTMGTIEHTAGEDVPAMGDPLSEERTVPVDSKQIMAPAWVPITQQLISHFDVLSKYAERAAEAVARTLDSRAMRMIALGARQAATGGGTFSNGVLLRKNAATLAAAYPATAAGALDLEDSLSEMAQSFDERNIPRDKRVAWMSPYLVRVASKSARMVNRDYSSLNQDGAVRQSVNVLCDFEIHSTNVLTSPPNVITGESAYQGDFTKTAVVCVASDDAVGAVQFHDIKAEGPTYFMEKQAHLLLAKWFGGMKWINKIACGELYVHTSAYS